MPFINSYINFSDLIQLINLRKRILKDLNNQQQQQQRLQRKQKNPRRVYFPL